VTWLSGPLQIVSYQTFKNISDSPGDKQISQRKSPLTKKPILKKRGAMLERSLRASPLLKQAAVVQAQKTRELSHDCDLPRMGLAASSGVTL